MALALLAIVFIVVPIFELWLILQVAELLGGGATGAALTILLLIADSLFGAWLLRSQGRSVWGELRTTLDAGKLPAREVLNGGFVVIGGVLLITPGFLSDILGFSMLLPPTRKFFVSRAYSFIAKRVRLATGYADIGVRDFARSEQPRRPTEGAAARAKRSSAADPEFDFETPRLDR